MALLASRIPRVLIEYGDGNFVEMKVRNIDTSLDHGKMGYTEVVVSGAILDSDVVKSTLTPTYPPHTIAGKAGEPRSVGGIPEECVLTCSACGFVDGESTHQCSV